VKFQSDRDAKLFLIEIGRMDEIANATRELKPTDEMIGLLKKARRGVSRGLKSFRRSQAGKQSWRKHSAEIMRGIKAFHRSTEGKRFHRNLSRFLLRKEFTGYLTGRPLASRNESMDFWEKADVIKAVSSAKTHLFIELEYYHPLYEQMGLEELALNHLSELSNIEQKILHDELISESDYSLLGLLTETNAVVKSLADKSGKSADEVEKMWKKIKQSLIDQGKSEDDENFFALLTGSLKNALKID
jgi:hypothetical protein